MEGTVHKVEKATLRDLRLAFPSCPSPLHMVICFWRSSISLLSPGAEALQEKERLLSQVAFTRSPIKSIPLRTQTRTSVL